ncbi:MAG TPA: thioredoxin family protein [Bacteroidota bacterium]
MKRFLSLVVLAVFVASFAIANDPVKPVKKMENFTLEDYNGVKHSLTDFKDSKAVVLMFIATQCPISNAYNARMAELYKDYKGKNIAFVGINSNKQESVEEIKDHAKKNGLDFTILKDWNNVQADKFEASFTPEIYVLNSSLELLYHGRIDNSRRMEEVKDKDLRRALDEILNGKDVSVTTTKAFGCTIKRVNQ